MFIKKEPEVKSLPLREQIRREIKREMEERSLAENLDESLKKKLREIFEDKKKTVSGGGEK
jgi:hypothetical protein